MRPAVRLGLIVLALMTSAWFGLSWYQARQTAKAQALIAGGNRLPVGQAREARQLLSSAGTLNPDRTVDILRAELAAEQGQYAGALRLLRSVTQSEPENLAAWIQLVFVAGRVGDQALARTGGRVVSSLIPKIKTH